MERIRFTTKVLGQAVKKLEAEEVTQTLRSWDSHIVQNLLNGRVKIGDQVHVILDDRLIGMVTISFYERVSWHQLDLGDAQRGGFSSLQELGQALKRAGYRFKTLDGYTFYRIQFQWLKEVLV